ncbi:fas apoptotic inhibitory molecule 1 isoform X1 [Nilaparvata lugens]|uniref:fas apoptotic inhibitory molecule 1 isoform X1 n=2 Tax=Nilaparvata lugens TaxID=108931 RepID=UPI00193E1BFC|nr:fas apoptotic inhibitory molecule 1 isoform X1 [Nilaparvata lugens]
MLLGPFVARPFASTTIRLINDPNYSTQQQGKGMSEDLVACWDVPMSDMVHRVEFEHGTTTGKRVLRLDGKEIHRKDWMFKLVGDEVFYIGRTKCIVRVEPSGGFSYEYSLIVDGKSLEKFTEQLSKTCCTWLVQLPQNAYRVVLERDTLDIWANGDKLEATVSISIQLNYTVIQDLLS